MSLTEQATPSRAPGARRAPKSSRWPLRRRSAPRGGKRRGGKRVLRVRRRAGGLPGTLGLTTLGAFLPGSGYLYAGRKALGALVLVVWLVAGAALLWYFGSDIKHALTGDVSKGFDHTIGLAFNPTLLRLVAVGLVLTVVVWAFIVFTSYRVVRPRSRPRWHTIVGYATVLVLVAVGGAPVVRVAQMAMVTADAVSTVFRDNVNSATAPVIEDESNPWAGKDRVNVLLLGGDGGDGRVGVRTDSMILVSMDTATGDTVLFSLPRNMMNAQFPDDSPLHDIYPDGYSTGLGDPGYDMLNAIYKTVPELHPDALGKTDNEGADAIKLAISGTLGVPVDYYLLVNLAGFKRIVDAMGGITVNINERVAVQGDTSAGIPPDEWLEPGPDQHLNGYYALWFARGRYGADDYQRMDRQRCAVDALIKAANPTTMLTRYIELAQAGKEVVYTDIPRKLGPAFVELLLEVKDAKVKSVVFRRSDKFNPSDPDFEYVHQTVQKVLDPVKKSGRKKHKAAEEENPVDACAYHPVDGDETDTGVLAGGLTSNGVSTDTGLGEP